MIGKNNPFNIRNNRKNKWLGQIGSRKGFCQFSSLDYGVRAACIILANYRKFGISTIFDIIKRWAPPSENDCIGYIRYIHLKTGIYSFSPLESEDQYVRVLVAMSEMEGNPVSPDVIFHLINQFNIKFFNVYEEEND